MRTSWVPSTAFDPADLDDVTRLLAADRDGWLHGTASAGSSVRAVAAQKDELARLEGNTVRSIVLVAPRGPARHAASLLQALLGGISTVPVLHAAHTPRWVGPLDVVVVCTDDAGDQPLAESVALAVGRGADVVLAAPEDGVLAPAGRGRALLLPPRLRIPDGMGLQRFVAVGLSVLGALQVAPTPDLDALADELDAEAERNQPSSELFANPAKSLAVRCADRRLVIAGDSAASRVLAGYVAASLLRHAGVVAAAAGLDEAVAAQWHQHQQDSHRPGRPEPVDSLFHDPAIDGVLPGAPVRAVVLGTADEEPRLRARSASLPDVELAVGAIDSGLLRLNAAAELLLLAARCETASVYLGLAA